MFICSILRGDLDWNPEGGGGVVAGYAQGRDL